ncbi:hypothetical protein QVD17_29778 [Tagetes erecta]|uniref:Uncharacterized protein n=1 Tax=Tagetes erecta TaxID=13708 RepID=A0AAD8K6L4_TARER|nr:hypothetical protein QVD17_29778 [Tagetes erecta]
MENQLNIRRKSSSETKESGQSRVEDDQSREVERQAELKNVKLFRAKGYRITPKSHVKHDEISDETKDFLTQPNPHNLHFTPLSVTDTTISSPPDPLSLHKSTIKQLL